MQTKGGCRRQKSEAVDQRVDGYEKVLGPTQVVIYIPVLNTLENLAGLYVDIGRTSDAWP
jgi:hypothetical protein